MNFGQEVIIAVVMFVLTFIVTKTIGQGAGAAVIFLLGVAAVLPLAIILFNFYGAVNGAGSNMTAMDAAAGKAITNIADWFVESLPGAIASDLVGMGAGALASIFIGIY